MKYFVLEPEVAGGLGPGTVMDRSTHPPKVERLHYEIQGWLGDVLLESFPCFIVTRDAADEMKKVGLSGARFEGAKITLSPEFMELDAGRVVPEFVRLMPQGEIGTDDICVMKDGRIVVSDRALHVLEKMGIKNCHIAKI